jgi:hypothetical protein
VDAREWRLSRNPFGAKSAEMFVNPPFQMRRYFEQERQSGRGLQPHLCSTGRIVFDPQGVMAAIQVSGWLSANGPLIRFS